MRLAGSGAAIALVALLAAPPAAASPEQGPELRFSLPATAGPDVAADAATWALLVFDGPDGQGLLDIPGTTQDATGYTWRRVYHGAPVGQAPTPYTTVQAPTSYEAHDAPLRSTGKSSVYVLADRVDVELGAPAGASLLGANPAIGLDAHVPNDLELEAAGPYRDMAADGRSAVLAEQGGQVTLRAFGVREVRTHGIAFGCAGCPTGEDRVERTTQLPNGRVEEKHLWFHTLTGEPGTLEMAGPAVFAMAGGPAFDVRVAGRVRLPLASPEAACDGCIAPQDQTLTATGDIVLAGFAAAEDGSATAFVGGDILAARLDEQAIDPALLWGGGGAAAVALGLGAVLLAKLLLAPLFTRLGRQEALEHPKRAAIYQYIQEHPGANFREVARNTGIAAGTVRHHLTVLERAGHIVEHPHEGTVRLFENHGKFDRNWADVVLLREPPLAQLHGWLKGHPGSAQKDVLEAMEAQGWSRSTTQHRLARLADGGLVAIRLQGRLKIYCVVDRAAERPLVSLPFTRAAALPHA